MAYLQGFHRELRRHADPVFAAIDEIEALGVDRLLDLALSTRSLPPAIGELTAAQVQSRRAGSRRPVGRRCAPGLVSRDRPIRRGRC